VVRFFLETGIVPSLLGFEVKERSLPKEESMPVVSVLAGLFDYLPFTQLSLCHPFLYLREDYKACHDFQSIFAIPENSF
jgi:hypothetical protein